MGKIKLKSKALRDNEWEIIEDDIPMAQDGSRINNPIYTNNPNDPRIQRYNDSLIYFNRWRNTPQQSPLADAFRQIIGVPVCRNCDRFNPEPVQPYIYQLTTLDATLPAPTVVTPSTTSTYQSLEPTRQKQNITPIKSKKLEQLQTQTINQELNKIPLKEGTYFSRERQLQEQSTKGKKDYFDKKSGKLLGTYKSGGSVSSDWEIMQEGGEISINEFRPKFANSNENIQNNLRLKEELGQRQQEKYQRDVAGQQATQQAVKNISSLNLKPKSEAFIKPVQELGLTQDNRYSPVNPLFTTLAPQWYDPNNTQDYEAAKFLTQDNTLSVAGEAVSTIPFSRLLKGVKPDIKQVANTYKSEIDWTKWNKEIPNNPQLMDEYNTIEQTSKANGSWMKNPDGSEFQGIPEQFVQQNSENFKNAFGNSLVRDEKNNILKMYHGSSANEPFDKFLSPKRLKTWRKRTQTTKETDHIYFSPDINVADKYSKRDLLGTNKGDIYEVYLNVKNPYYTNNYIEQAMPEIIKNKIKKSDAVTNIDFSKKESLKSFHEIAVPYGNYPKSTTGNNGMFDMTNPNIYKSLAPTAIGVGAASQIKQKKKLGGKINSSDWEIIQD